MGNRRPIKYARGQKLHPHSRLTYVADVDPHQCPSGQRHRKALFSCECGGEVEAFIACVKSGDTKSCGCFQVEVATTHGLRKHPLYSTWANMLARCEQPDRKEYPNYGGRGITVCRRWRVFENFISDMGERPDGHHIDRIDNNVGYSPANCRWATRKQNQRNMRNSKYWHIDGVRYESSPQAARALGVSAGKIKAMCDGWTKNGKFYPPKHGCYSVPKYAA